MTKFASKLIRATIAAATLVATSTSAFATRTVQLPAVNAYGYVTEDKDKINIFLDKPGAQPGQIKICLTTNKEVTWWKGVELMGLPGGRLGFVEAKDGSNVYHSQSSNNPTCAIVDAGEFAPNYSEIRLLKMKALGVIHHIETFKFDPYKLRGKQIWINWNSD